MYVIIFQIKKPLKNTSRKWFCRCSIGAISPSKMSRDRRDLERSDANVVLNNMIMNKNHNELICFILHLLSIFRIFFLKLKCQYFQNSFRQNHHILSDFPKIFPAHQTLKSASSGHTVRQSSQRQGTPAGIGCSDVLLRLRSLSKTSLC